MIDESLKQWATKRQAEYIDAVNKSGSNRAASKVLGVNCSVIDKAIHAVRAKAAVQGHSPQHNMVHEAPEPFVVKGVSTLYGDDGAVKAQWVKTKLDEQKQLEAIKDYIEWLVTDAKGIADPVKAPKVSNQDLLSIYPVADLHFGLYAWAEETGDDFDLAKAESLTVAGFNRLAECSPPSEHALLLGLGDLLHADDSRNVTPTSGFQLDVDTRHAKVMQVALRALKHGIDALLAKHKTVTVWVKGGNHDPHSSFAIALCLASFYEREPRLTVDLSPSLFSYMRFGKVLIGSTHGHTVKPADLPSIMATDRAEDWGNTQYRYWYTGHIHHKTRHEQRGVVSESFRTLAAKDAWHAGRGFRSGRDMELIVHHRDHGEIERHVAALSLLTTQ